MTDPNDLDALDDVAFCCRLAHYLDGQMSPSAFAMLNAELLDDAGKRSAFVRVCQVRALLVRAGTVSRDVAELASRVAAGPPESARPGETLDAPADADAARAGGGPSLDDAMILPAVTDAEVDVAPTWPGPTAAGPYGRPVPSRASGRRWTAVAATLAAVAVIGVGLSWGLRPRRPGVPPALPPATPAADDVAGDPFSATVTATAAAVVDGADGVRPGTGLLPGRTLRLSAGAIELTFATGATVVVRAPAQVRVSDRNALVVDAGSVCAHVPPAAKGFRVSAPGLDVVDQGTNFGVRTRAGGVASAEVHVFEGRVDAAGLDAGGHAVGPPATVTAGHAVSHAATAAAPALTPVPYVPAEFVPDIGRLRLPVPAHGTGGGVAAGSPDPAWQLVAGPADPAWHPGPVVVVLDPRPEYVPNSPAAQWVSTSAHMANVAGGRYTYRTTIDLTGFEPGSVSARATFAADDGITDVRVNRADADVPAELTRDLDAGAARTAVHQMSLTNVRWINGPNQVDITVINSSQFGPNYTGLQLGWDVTASPVVHR